MERSIPEDICDFIEYSEEEYRRGAGRVEEGEAEYEDSMGSPLNEMDHKYIPRHREPRMNRLIYEKHNSVARSGDLESFTLLHRQTGTVGDYYTCSNAAEGGHLDIVKYIHSQGVQLEDSITYYAAKSGHFPTLQYLYEVGLFFIRIA
jgi:hypothetical protein